MVFSILWMCMFLAASQGAFVENPHVLPYSSVPSGYSGHYSISPALVSQDSNIIRSYGNLGQVATLSKKISTPYSSVEKSDIRITNPAAYPEIHHPAAFAYASPPVHHAAPIAYPAPPAPVKEIEHIPAPTAIKQIAPSAFYSQPKVLTYPSAPVHHGASLLGVAYSSAPVVSHMTYSNGYGVSYGY